jgi:CDP-6-deoxy-D-xylo-4-hexulose-3-dehydrase
LLFAGDIRKQPYFKNISFRSIGNLTNTNVIVQNTFWIGVCPSISKEMVEYVIAIFDDIFTN